MKPIIQAHQRGARRTGAVLLACLLGLTACGGSGSGSSTPAPAVNANGETVLAMVTRALPAFDVQVTPYKSGTSATVTRFDVKVADASKVTALTASVGVDYDTATAATVTASGSGTWSVAVPAGASADANLLLSFNLADGDAFETGKKDFPLK